MIPSNWNEISVSQFQELRQLGVTPSDSLTDRYIDTLLTVSEYDLEELEDMSIDELTDIIAGLGWLRKEPHKKYAKNVGEYSIINFKKITWGMFIDLEYYYSDYIENLPVICGILYRQQKEDEWGNVVIEPYKYDPKVRAELFKTLPITSVYGVATSYLDFRNDLINVKYSNLFDSGEDYEAPEDLKGEDLKEWEKEKAEEEKFNKWSYESITLSLANNDITKMDEVLNKSLIYVLNMLSMKAELD